MRMNRSAVVVPALLLAGWTCSAVVVADTIWDEDSYGDLSDDRFDPTPLYMPEGVWSLYAYSGVYGEGIWDREYFTVTIPAGAQLSQLILVDYFGEDEAAFVGVQAGATMTVDPDNATPAELLGWYLFGPAIETLGTDYLPLIGQGPGSIGFSPPLPAGQYTFWMQQAGPICNYQWDFVVTPEPGSLLLASLALAALFRRR